MANEQQQQLDPVSIAQSPAMRASMDPRTAAQADIIDIGFAQAGRIFGGGDPNVAAAYRQTGQNITGILQQRWFQKEYENFDEQALQPLAQKVMGIQDSLVEKFGQLDAGQLPDGSGPINPDSFDSAKMKQRLLYTHIHEANKAVQELFAAAAKYGSGNPFITQRVLDIVSSTSTTVSSLTDPSMAKREQEFSGLEKTQAETGLLGAQTEEAQERAALLKRTDPNLKGQVKDEAINAEQYLKKYGPGEALTYMLQGQAGWMQPYREQEMAKMQAQISEDAMDPKNKALAARLGVTFDKNGVPQSAPDPAAVEAAANEKKVEVMEKAAVEAAKSLYADYPEVANYIKSRPNLAQWLEGEVEAAKAKPIFTGRATEADIRTKAQQDWENEIKPGLDQAIQQGDINNKTQIAEWLRDKVEQYISETVGTDPTSRDTAKKLGDEILRISKKKWTESDLARELTGEFSWFERGGRAIGRVKRGLLD